MTNNRITRPVNQVVTLSSIKSTENDFIISKGIESTSAESFIFAMFPSIKTSSLFNENQLGEWKIQRNRFTTFIIYGINLNGSTLSFTTHPDSCALERKDHLYLLTVDNSFLIYSLIEQTTVTINLPYYASKLYVCLQPSNSSNIFHQGKRPSLTIDVIRNILPIWATIICLIILLTLSSLFSGLNLGLMSYTPHDLVVIQAVGTPIEKQNAKIIHPVRKRGNFLLCTILLGNVLVNSTSTILLDTLISGIFAVVGSTFAIVIFGEIIPQALCSRHGLTVGAKTILFTRLFMILMAPIAFPLGKILDLILGEEVGATYTRDQMSALLKHTQTTDIEDREKNIMTGVLSLKTKRIREIMTNVHDVFMLDADQVVDDQLVLDVHERGYSRIPVYEKQRENIIGIINIRDFALLDTESGKFTVRTLMDFYKHRYGQRISPDDSCYDVFEQLKKEQYHLGVVVEFDEKGEADPRAKAIGIVTFEDIIEEMIQEEIVDETDVFTDNRRKVRNALSQTRNLSAFVQQTETTEDTTKVSAQIKVAILQFLSTTVEPFTSRFMSSNILARLLNKNIYKEYKFDEEKMIHIYEYGKAADYFVLILDGRAELITGKEKIVSDVGSFSYFGVSALCNCENKVEDLLHSKDQKSLSFVPDFSLRVCEDLQILYLTRSRWLAAIRASFFESKQSESGEKIDLLTEELEKINDFDQSEMKNERLSEVSSICRPRSMTVLSSANAMSMKSESEKLFTRIFARKTSVNVDRISTNSPNSAKQRHLSSRIYETLSPLALNKSNC